MDRTLICRWLGLAVDHWPPDHYELLDLEPGEADIARIEQRVHERMQRVRCYQLSQPEEATEGMNRLAQALVCLADAAAKKAYDASLPACLPLGGEPAPQARASELQTTAPPVAPALPERKGAGQAPPAAMGTALDWDTAPAPALVPSARPSSGGAAIGNGTGAEPLVDSKKSGPTPILFSAPVDPVFETARSSPAARRGLGTRRALYNRLALTRRLQRAWEQVGAYLGQARSRVTRPEDEASLVEKLATIRELIEDFPAFLGRPGQPGQHVVCIARQNQIAATFKGLDFHQRTALAQDWMAGRTLLEQHRRFVRLELQVHRRRSWLSRKIRAARAALNDHPGYVILGVGCVALAIFLFHWLTAPVW
jgi:hypothetical protein